MPPVDGPVLVWRLGDTLLAVALAAVEEVLPVGGDGRVHGRAGEIQVARPAPLGPAGTAPRAVVIREGDGSGARRIALPADEVEGVVEPQRADGMPPPAWLSGVHAPHIAALVRLETGRVAALLDLAELFRGE